MLNMIQTWQEDFLQLGGFRYLYESLKELKKRIAIEKKDNFKNMLADKKIRKQAQAALLKTLLDFICASMSVKIKYIHRYVKLATHFGMKMEKI